MSTNKIIGLSKKPLAIGGLLFVVLFSLTQYLAYQHYQYHALNKSHGFFTPAMLSLFGTVLSLALGLLVYYTIKQSLKANTLFELNTLIQSKSNKDYGNIFEQTTDAIVVFDFDLNVIDANESMCILSGYSLKELKTMRVPDFNDLEDLQAQPLNLKIIEEGQHLITNRRLKTKNNQLIEMEVNVKKISPNRILSIARNISQIKEIEKQKDLSDSIFSSAFEYSALGKALVLPNAKFVKVNKELSNIVGYTENELLTMSFKDFTHPDDLAKDLQFVEDAIAGKIQTYRVEKRYIHKNGSVIWVNANISVIRDVDGKILFFVSQIENITQRIKISEQLKERENQLQIFVEHSPAAIAMFDKEMRYVQVSRRWLRDYRLEGQNIIGKSHYEIFPNLPPHWYEIHQRCIQGSVEKNDDDSFTREDGTLEWLKWEIHPWRKASNEIGGIIMMTEVITEKKEADLKFRNLVEKSPVGVYIVQDGKFVYVNPALSKITGYSEDELLNNMSVYDLALPDFIDFLKEQTVERLKESTKTTNYEVRGKRKDGTSGWVEIYGATTFYNGSPALIGTFSDVTLRKESAALLLREKKLADAIINTLPGIFYMADSEGYLLRWNKNMQVVTGLNEHQLSEKRTIDIVHPNYIPLILSKREDIMSSGSSEIELAMTNAKKELRYYQFTVMKLIYDEEIRLVGVGVDVTEQKAAQLTLFKKNAEIRERVKELNCLYRLSEVANDPKNTMEDILNRSVEIIPSSYQFSEITCSRITFNGDVYLSRDFQESMWRQACEIYTNNALTGRIEIFYKEETPQEQEGPFLHEERLLLNSAADIIASAFEKRNAEKTLQLSEEKYKYLFHNNPAIIIIWDAEQLNVLEINNQAVNMYGYSREEFIGMSVLHYRPTEDHDIITEFANHMLTEDVPKLRNKWRHLKKNGEIMYMDITSHKMEYNGRKAVLSLAKDITEQHKAEEQLKSTNEDIRRLNKHLQTARETERTIIAREIHDELGQQLTGLKMDVSWVTKKLDIEDQDLKNKTFEIVDSIDNTIKTVRKIATDLRPGILDDLGLIAALEWQTNEFEKRSGTSCMFISNLSEKEPEKTIATCIFRIYQESLTNVMRHSGATHVDASINIIRDMLVLTITDNGKGFEESEVKGKKTLGLIGMIERAEAFGGKLQVESSAGLGTTVTLKMPFTIEA